MFPLLGSSQQERQQLQAATYHVYQMLMWMCFFSHSALVHLALLDDALALQAAGAAAIELLGRVG